MTIAPLRTQQTTTTTGAGTLTLIAAATNVRSFNAALGGSSIVTPYVISGATYFEIGIGTYDGGTPGTLTRTTILASSNAGAAVSLPAGTHDVFVPFLPGLRGTRTGTGSDTATAAWAGERYAWGGTSAGTLTLPAIATMPQHVPILVENTGTDILTIDGNASELINDSLSILLYPRQRVELFRRNSVWETDGNYNRMPIRKTGVGATVSGVDTITFGTAFPNAIDASTITITIAGGTVAASLHPLILGASSVTGFEVFGDASESLDFVWAAEGY